MNGYCGANFWLQANAVASLRTLDKYLSELHNISTVWQVEEGEVNLSSQKQNSTALQVQLLLFRNVSWFNNTQIIPHSRNSGSPCFVASALLVLIIKYFLNIYRTHINKLLFLDTIRTRGRILDGTISFATFSVTAFVNCLHFQASSSVLAWWGIS